MYKQIHVLIWFVEGGKGRARGSANFGKLADKQIFNATLVGSSGRQGLPLYTYVWVCGSVAQHLQFALYTFPFTPFPLPLSLSFSLSLCTHLLINTSQKLLLRPSATAKLI